MKDTFKRLVLKAIWHINAAYSVVWMRLHHADKWRYRDESKIHDMLMSAGMLLMGYAKKGT